MRGQVKVDAWDSPEDAPKCQSETCHKAAQLVILLPFQRETYMLCAKCASQLMAEVCSVLVTERN